MKTTMKMMAVMAVMMGFAFSAMGQQSHYADIVGTASVTAQVSVAKGSDLDFKNVTPGVAKTIDFTNTVTAGTPTTGEKTGRFDITKGANTQITLAFTTLPTDLAGTGDAINEELSIEYTAQLFKDGEIAPHPIATPAQGNTVVVQNSSTTAPYYAASSFQLDLGGTVSPDEAQKAGTYSGTITLTATYN